MSWPERKPMACVRAMDGKTLMLDRGILDCQVELQITTINKSEASIRLDKLQAKTMMAIIQTFLDSMEG